MTLVITFRALSPLVAMLVERFFYPNPLKISCALLGATACMILGCLVYTIGMEFENAQIWGILYSLLNNFFGVGDRLLQRLMLANDQHPVDISKSGCTVLNNVLGKVPLFIAAALMQEYKQIPEVVSGLDVIDYVWVIASCFVGLGISYTGVWVQSMISASSFLVLVNANKFFIIFLEIYVLRRKKPITPVQVTGATITILSAVAFGKAKQALEEREECKETDSLVESAVAESDDSSPESKERVT